MRLQIKGKNLEVSDSIRAYAEQKLRKLEKQLGEQVQVELELSCDCQPCGRWEDGYLECYPETYDHSYRIGWDAAHCDSDTAI